MFPVLLVNLIPDPQQESLDDLGQCFTTFDEVVLDLGEFGKSVSYLESLGRGGSANCESFFLFPLFSFKCSHLECESKIYNCPMNLVSNYRFTTNIN